MTGFSIEIFLGTGKKSLLPKKIACGNMNSYRTFSVWFLSVREVLEKKLKGENYVFSI